MKRLPAPSANGLEKTQNKIKDLDSLVSALDAARARKKRIVHCHGVFDLLHIGHIRHFKQAKRFGDVLVVSVTPDRYVNKGPHRPVFHENLRAEAIAALDCVDFVFLNRWRTAVETIGAVKPDFYVKGSDYREAKKDYTGGIGLEEAAVKAVGGKIVFTDDIVFSSTSLLNRRLPVFPKEVSDYLAGFTERHSIADVFRPLEAARKLKVLVLGETIIDEYRYCEAIGKSSKEPTLVVKHLQSECFAGGILAVGNHVASFCDQVGLGTYLGSLNSREDFIREKLKKNVSPKFLYQEDAPTIVKRRYVESYFFNKMLEIYEINDGAMSAKDRRKLCDWLDAELPRFDVVIVADYGHGMFSDESIKILSKKARFLAVNAQSNAGNRGFHTIGRYPRADFVCLAEQEIRMESRDRRGDLKDLILGITKRLPFRKMIVTRGKAGCICYDRKEGFVEIPSFAGEILDRVGAGDAFLSVASLCVAQKAPMEITGFIGNAAGAQAVATVGNRSFIEKAPLLKHIESLLK